MYEGENVIESIQNGEFFVFRKMVEIEKVHVQTQNKKICVHSSFSVIIGLVRDCNMMESKMQKHSSRGLPCSPNSSGSGIVNALP